MLKIEQKSENLHCQYNKLERKIFRTTRKGIQIKIFRKWSFIKRINTERASGGQEQADTRNGSI